MFVNHHRLLSGSLVLALLVLFTSPSFAAEPKGLFSHPKPYAPRDTDYSIELGTMWERNTLYWLGGNIGQHVGLCWFSASQTCQQYIDFIFGFAGRDSETHGLFLISPRWQFVSFPQPWSPFLRVFAGSMIAHRPQGDDVLLASGAGYGVTLYLNDKVDLRIEGRLGYSDHLFSQAVIGAQIKVDRLLSYFAEKLKDLGIGTIEMAIEATGTAVQATGEGVGAMVKTVTSPLQQDAAKDTSDPNSQPDTDSEKQKKQTQP